MLVKTDLVLTPLSIADFFVSVKTADMLALLQCQGIVQFINKIVESPCGSKRLMEHTLASGASRGKACYWPAQYIK